jgi:hypothetical protein
MLWEDLQATSLAHLTKKWRQVKPKWRQENNQTWFFLAHIWFTPSEGPKAFKTYFLRSWTMNSDHWQSHLPSFDFMVHSVNCPSVDTSMWQPPQGSCAPFQSKDITFALYTSMYSSRLILYTHAQSLYVKGQCPFVIMSGGYDILCKSQVSP